MKTRDSILGSTSILALLLFSLEPARAAPAEQCPPLAGRYHCKGITMSYSGTITQSERGGKPHYAVELGDAGGVMRFEVIADGLQRSERRGGSTLRTVAACSSQRLDVTLDMSNTKDRYRLITETKWRRQNAKIVRVDYHAIETDRGSEMEYDERFICTHR